jgi:phage host-nuclease inhibitor protein Gam
MYFIMANKRKYDDIIIENEVNYKLIAYYENQIKKLKIDIDNNKKEIQEECEHEYERIAEYGERTYFACKICEHNTRSSRINF